MKRCSLPVVVSFVFVLGLTGCDHNSSVGVEYDAGCACAQEQVCFNGTCCTPTCAGKSCGSDGCGGTCTGSCDPGWTCDENDGQCHCAREDDATFCERKGVTCGKAAGTDTCGADRDVNCDRCALPETCNQATATCECIPAPDAQLCTTLNKQCGTLTATDNCLAERQIDCGSCQPGFLCDAATNLCERCTPETDAALCRRMGLSCGNYTGPDKCNNHRIAYCGQCDPGFECNPLGTCVTCTPMSDADFCTLYGAQCGTVANLDTCLQTRTVDCGACADHGSCDDHHHCQPCVPDLDTTLCAAHHRSCGPLAADDNCGVARAVAECGPCPGPLDRCETATGTCVTCVPETDGELCDFYFKNCGAPTITDRCGQTRTPNCTSTPCAAGLTCQPNGVCGNGTSPTNDICTSPERLVFDVNGIASATGDSTNATDDSAGSCGGALGNDLVYFFTLAASANVTVTVAAIGSPPIAQPVAYLRTSGTGACAGTVDVACSFAPSVGGTATFTRHALQAGDYFLIVDGYASNSGPFSLTVTQGPVPPQPPNDTCATPEALNFVNGVATVTGDTTNCLIDYADTCGYGTLDGGDLFYQFSLTSPSMVLARVTRGSTSTTYYPAIELLSSCPSGGAALACGTQNSGVASLGSANLPAGDYYIVVDGTLGSYGDFTLQVTTSAPLSNDLCSGATPIDLNPVAGSTDLTGSATGDTSVANDDYTSSCNTGGTGKDLVYSFTVPAGSVYDVRAELQSMLGSGLQPNLFLRTNCPPNGMERGCDYSFSSGSAVTLSAHRLGAGTYYAFVDGYTPFANGPFTLTLTASLPPPPPPNDLCAGATTLLLDPATKMATVTGSTANASDDYQGSCSDSSTPHSGSDLVYAVTTAAAGNIAARVQRDSSTSGGFEPAVYIQTSCGGADVACGNFDWNGLAKASATDAPAGTYYIVVDGANATYGDFTLEVVTYAPHTNDSCASPTVMSFDANGDFHDRGDLCAMSNDTQNQIGGTCTMASGFGNDAVYQLDLTQPKALTVTFNSGQPWTSEVYLRSGSCGTGAQLMCSSADNGAPNVLAVKYLAPGTYYLFLDNNWASDCGIFSMTAHLADPPPPPNNDICTRAEVIAITGGAGSATGTTESALDDSVGGCGGPDLGGGDVVYSFTLPQAQTIDIQVLPQVGSDLVPTVYLRSTCDAASSERLCATTSEKDTLLELQHPRLAAGTYCLIVDSADHLATGAFSISIATSTPPAPAPNDVCTGAAAMPAFDPVTGKTSIAGNTLNGSDDDTSHCASGNPRVLLNGADLVYQFTLGSDARVTATVTRDAGATTYKPAVSVRRGCAIGDEVACATDSPTSPSGSASVTESLTTGTWYVFVDGLDSTFGGFTLELSKAAAAPAPGDSCGNAVALSFTNGTATVSGDLLAGGTSADYVSSACASWWGGPDLVYSMTLATDAFVSVQLAGQGQLEPNVYLRATCDSPATELGCGFSSTGGGTASFSTARLPAGTYYLFVDSFSASYADLFTLTVTTTDPVGAPPANDTCRTPTALTLDPTTHAARVSGDTRGAVSDYAGTGASCAGVSAPLSGGDLVYSVSVPQGATLGAALTRDTSTASWQPALYIQSTCGSSVAAHQLACNATTADLTAVTASNLSAGTYYLIVDGQAGSGGLFTLDVFVRTAALTNMTCATAEPLTFTAVAPGVEQAVALGDTTIGASRTEGLTQGSQLCFSSGPEVYYGFTTTATKDLTIDVTPLSANYAAAFYVRSACSDPATQVVCNISCCGPLSATKLKLPAGAWIVVGDTEWGGSGGPFALKVTLSDPPPAPANDTCLGAQRLTLPDSGQPALTLTNLSTTTANDDYAGGCQTASAPHDGPDLVYSFTLATATQVKVVVTPTGQTPSFMPAAYIRRTCASVDNDVCRYANWAGNPVTLAASLQAGDYYLIVDGQSGTYGAFDLSLETDDTKYLEGDHCLNAKAIDSMFVPGSNPSEVVATLTGDTSLASDDGSGSCNAYSGGDLVYSFTVLRDSFVRIDVARSGPPSLYAANPYLRTTCADGAAEVYCESTYDFTPQSAFLYHVQPGSYFLWIDSYSNYSSGAFTATVSVRDTPVPPANDLCRGAIGLNFVSGGGTASTATLYGGDSTFATNDTGGSCQASTGNDLVYLVIVSGSAKSLTATVTPDASAPALKPVIYLRTVCDQSADLMEVACGTNTNGGPIYPASITVNSLPVGTYYLYVDSYRADPMDPPGGKFNLTATLDAPVAGPANDSCPFAEPIALAGPAPSTTTLSAQTTVGALDSTASTCGATSGPGGDVVYSLTLTDPAELKVKVTPDASFYPALYLRRTCGSTDPSNEIACAASSFSATSQEVTKAYARPGTYYVWVDAGTSTPANAAGTFQLEVTLSVPTQVPPANDVCSGAVPLVLGAAPTNGTGTNANLDYPTAGTVWTPACQSYAWHPAAPDLVYTYTPTNSGNFTVSLDAPAWDSMLWYNTGTCGDASTCGAIHDEGNPESIAIAGVAGTPYYFYVTSYSSSVTVGNFTMKVY